MDVPLVNTDGVYDFACLLVKGYREVSSLASFDGSDMFLPLGMLTRALTSVPRRHV